LNSAATDGRFLTFAITDDRKGLFSSSAATDGRFLVLAITDDRKN
jgi:hypothetical protein